MKKLTERQIGYLAALIDGEGTIGMSRQRKPGSYLVSYAPYIHTNNTYRAVLDWCKDTTGLGIVDPAHKDLRSNRKDMYRWRLYTEEMSDFLQVIQPALVIKWEQAELVLEFLRDCYGTITDSRQDQRQLIFEELATLNRRGT